MAADGDKPRKVVQDTPEEESPRSAAIVKTKVGLDYGEETFTKDAQHYKIISVNDPFQFWMVKETGEKNGIFSQLRIFSKLQEIMAKQETTRNQGKKEVPPPPVHLEKFKLYLTFHKGVNKWHRVRLLRFDKKTASLLIYFVDYPLLELAQVPVDSLRDLPDECVGYPVVSVYKSYLYDVTPGLRDYEWRTDTLDWFQRAVKKGSVWVGLQMAWRAKWVENGPDQKIDVGVVLFEDNDSLERSMSLNYRLVKLDHGRAIGIGATHSSNLYFPEGEPLFSLEHIPPIPNTDWSLGKLPAFVGNRWPQVAIRRVKGPNCIYVTLRNKYKEYLAMQWKIREIFESGLPKINSNYLGIGLGCLVGFRNLRTQKLNVYRCVVVRVNGPKTVEVLLVDVGDIGTVPVSTLYALPKRVKLIPAFVHRVHLNTMAPPPHRYLNFLKWTGEMDEEFDKFVKEIGFGKSGEKGEPAWFAVRSDLPDNGDVISLREVCQDLAYDKGDKQWIGMSMTAGNLQNYENQVMIKNHLRSFGVDLLVLKKKEKARGEHEEDEEGINLGFESLAEIIAGEKERFEVELVGKKRDKKGYYDGLLEWNEKFRGEGEGME